MYKTLIDRRYEKLYRRLEKKVKLPQTLSFRQWNAEEAKEAKVITGRVQKFIFTLIVLLVNAILAILLFFLSSSLFSWLFFGLVLASLVPKAAPRLHTL